MYKVAVLNCKDKFKEWIEKNGGVTVWQNTKTTKAATNEIFTPALTENGKEYPRPSNAVAFKETVKDLGRFKFAREIKEVKRIKIAYKIEDEGATLRLTQHTLNKLKKAMETYGNDAKYYLDFGSKTAIITVPVWEEE